MRKLLPVLLILLALPFPAYAREGLFWTPEGSQQVATNEIGESLMLGESREERNGFTEIVGVTFTIFAPEENGEPKWTTYGGNGTDKLEHAAPADDGWIAVGSSSSSDLENGWHLGDYDNKEGKTDAWVVRLDSEGEVRWTRCYGGSDWDSFNAVCPAPDGGWILAGYTHSSDGDVVGWHDSGELYAQPDGWIVHIDDDGEILWQRTLGGSDYDELFAIRQVPGGYMAVGETGSTDGDVQGLTGGTDAWVVLLDTEGTLLRQVCYGGADDDSFTALSAEADGRWLAAGTSWSFDEADTSRAESGWAVSLDAEGNAAWRLRFGGEVGVEYAQCIIPYPDYWVLAGYTQPMGEEASDWIVGMRYTGDAWALLEGAL